MAGEIDKAHMRSVEGAIDSSGNWFPLASCEIKEYDNADGTLNYIDATIGGQTWRQTYTYSNVNPKRTTSQWVKQ